MPVDVFAEVPERSSDSRGDAASSARRGGVPRGRGRRQPASRDDRALRRADHNPLGDVATFSVHGPGEVFGLFAVLHPEARRTATVVALERAETLAIPKSAFVRLRTAHPGSPPPWNSC